MEPETNQQTSVPQLCKSGCGFYGSSSTDGLCSKCYKDTVITSQQSMMNDESRHSQIDLLSSQHLNKYDGNISKKSEGLNSEQLNEVLHYINSKSSLKCNNNNNNPINVTSAELSNFLKSSNAFSDSSLINSIAKSFGSSNVQFDENARMNFDDETNSTLANKIGSDHNIKQPEQKDSNTSSSYINFPSQSIYQSPPSTSSTSKDTLAKQLSNTSNQNPVNTTVSSIITSAGSVEDASQITNISSLNTSNIANDSTKGNYSVSLPLTLNDHVLCSTAPVSLDASPEDSMLSSASIQSSPNTSLSRITDNITQPKNRCFTCRKKVGLSGFPCRCGGTFCSAHRYSDKHNCTFDYKELAQKEIRKNNPVIQAQKIQKI